MNRRLIAYTIVAFLLLSIYLWYFFNSQIKNNGLVDAGDDLETTFFTSGDEFEHFDDNNVALSTGELEQLEKLFQNKTANQLEEMAKELSEAGDFEKAIKIFEKINNNGIYDRQLLSLYEKNYDFKHIKDVLDKYNNLSGEFLELYLKSQLNLLDTDINNFSSFLDELKAANLLTTGDWRFYKGLTALYKGHFEDFKYFLDRIPENSRYYAFRKNIEKQLNKYESFRDVPKYYRDALISYELFKIGYIGLAQKMAFSVYASKPSYILPNQILAYSYFLQGHRKKSQKYLKNLLKFDPSNKELYALLLGITYFYLQDYSSAVSYLHMAKGFELSYHFLTASLIKKGNIDDILKLYYPLSLEGKLTTQEYWILFRYLFLDNRALRELPPQQQILLSKIVNSCYKDIQEQRICDLGQAGLMLSQDHTEQAVKYLEKFVDYYPSDNLFARLGNWRESRDIKKAKQFYLKAIVAASNDSLKDYYKKQILDLILKKKDK